MEKCRTFVGDAALNTAQIPDMVDFTPSNMLDVVDFTLFQALEIVDLMVSKMEESVF